MNKFLQVNTDKAELLSNILQQNIKKILTLTGNSSDITIRTFQGANGLPMAIVYIKGLTKTEVIIT
ncbi:hypothetical protein [Paenibacillus sp. FSL H7-0331]|uniref:hypothetical protein n=1 Tax=Paenibacillus sp. FSL H7-0331 TaxID=1920421 RepID=UPI00096C85AA|nr:hypothetical protein [Paenibacillus sp. FSL H7-0331]OMF15838.1 hypothetical protein BK127_16085 [Paenibacillus sp. FSL H7-0331]